MRDWLTARPLAHRGLHDTAAGVIENTASAFQAAVDGGYGIECDVQLSADGEAMVHHDDTLDRLMQQPGAVAALTAAELKRIAYRQSGDRMLTLGELCDLVGGRATLLVEMKSGFAGDNRLAARTAAVLRGRPEPIAVMSFDPTLMLALRRADPSLPRGLVAMRSNPDASAHPGLWRLWAAGAAAGLQFMAYRVQDLTGPAPRLARALLRWPLLTWTVRTDAERALAARGADQIIFEGCRP